MKISKFTAALFLGHLMLSGSVFAAQAACAEPTQAFESRRVLRWADRDQANGAVYSTFAGNVRMLVGEKPVIFIDLMDAVGHNSRHVSFDEYNRLKETTLNIRRTKLVENLTKSSLSQAHKDRVLQTHDFIIDSYAQGLQGFMQQARLAYEQFENFQSRVSSAYGMYSFECVACSGDIAVFQENEHLQLLVCSKLAKLQHDFEVWRNSFYVSPVTSSGNDYTLAAFIFDCDAVLDNNERDGVDNHRLKLLNAMASGDESEIARKEASLRLLLPPYSSVPFTLSPLSILQRNGEPVDGEVINLTPAEADEVMGMPHQLPFKVKETPGFGESIAEVIRALPEKEHVARARVFDEEITELRLLVEESQRQLNLAQEEAFKRKKTEEKRRLDESKVANEKPHLNASEYSAYQMLNADIQKIMTDHAEALRRQGAGARSQHGYTLKGEGITEYGKEPYDRHNYQARATIARQLSIRGIAAVQLITGANVDAVLADLEQWMNQVMTRGIGVDMRDDITASFASFRSWAVKNASEHQGFFGMLLALKAFDGYVQEFPEGSKKTALVEDFSSVLVGAMSVVVEHKGKCVAGAKGRELLMNHSFIKFLNDPHQPKAAAAV